MLEGDIKSCFDRISHSWLLAHVPMDRAMLRHWLQAGYLEKHVLHSTDEGTPQGGIISPVLANLSPCEPIALRTWLWTGWSRSCGKSIPRPPARAARPR